MKHYYHFHSFLFRLLHSLLQWKLWLTNFLGPFQAIIWRYKFYPEFSFFRILESERIKGSCYGLDMTLRCEWLVVVVD